jgi:hypothetical protein
MTRSEKLIATFRMCRGPFPFRDFERLLAALGYKQVKTGGGSSRKFFSREHDDMIMLHEPHDGMMRPVMVKRLQDHLEARGML